MNNNTNRLTIETDDFSILAILHPPHTWQRQTKTRVYVDGEDAVDFGDAHDLNSKLGFPLRGEHVELDKLFDKLNRQVVKNKRAVIEEARQTSEEADCILAQTGKLTFSRKAGCSCGCSPAFVPENMVNISGRNVESLFVTRKAA